jgi:hypothetical protein
VQAQRENTILEPSTKATIDALVGEGFNAPRTLRDHVKRWADMISADLVRTGCPQGGRVPFGWFYH